MTKNYKIAKKIKGIGAKFVLVAGGLFVGLLLLELLFWAFYPQLPSFLQPDPVLGTKHIPNLTVRQADGCIRATTYFNREGMADRDHDISKPAGTYRIAILGDSYVEAMQVNFDDTFFRQLESQLKDQGKNVEVLAFGVGGFGTFQEYLLLRDYALKYKPDLVILSFLTQNDVRNNSFALEQSREMPYATVMDGTLQYEPFSIPESYQKTFNSRWRTLIFDRSHLIRFLYRTSSKINWWRKVLARFNFQAQSDVPTQTQADMNLIYATRPSEDWEKAWLVTESLILKIKQEATEHGAEFLLLSLTNAEQLSEDLFKSLAQKYSDVPMDRTVPEKRLHNFSEKQNIDYLSALPMMEKLYQDEVEIHPECHGHWSLQAHHAAGAMLADHILKNYLK